MQNVEGSNVRDSEGAGKKAAKSASPMPTDPLSIIASSAELDGTDPLSMMAKEESSSIPNFGRKKEVKWFSGIVQYFLEA